VTLSLFTTRRHIREVQEYRHPVLTSASECCEWSSSQPGRLNTGIHGTGNWVDRMASLDVEELDRSLLPLPVLEPRSRSA